MSIVGPRPDLVEQVANYEPDATAAASPSSPGSPAGRRCTAATRSPGRSASELDVWYVDNWSLWLDARIVLMTFTQLGRPEPAAGRGHAQHRARQRRSRTPTVRELDAAAEWDGAAGELDAYYRRAVRRERGAARPAAGRSCSSTTAPSSPAIEREGPRDVITPVRLRRAGRRCRGLLGARTTSGARERGVVSTFVRFHPLLREPAGRARSTSSRSRRPSRWRLDAERDLLARPALASTATSRAQGRERRRDDGRRPRRRPRRVRRRSTRRRCAASDADAFYFFAPAYWERSPSSATRSSASTPRSTARSSRARSASPRRRGCTTTSAARPTTGRTTRRHRRSSCSRPRAGRRRTASSASTSAAASAAGSDSLHRLQARASTRTGLVEAAVGKAIHDEDAYRAAERRRDRLRRLLPRLSPAQRVPSRSDPEGDLLGEPRRARLDARRLSARRGGAARACARGRCARTTIDADRHADRPRARRGGRDRRAASRTCSRSTTRPTSSRSSSPPTARPTAPTRSSSGYDDGRVRLLALRARREAAGAEPRGPRDRERDRRLRRRERDLGAGRAAQARAQLRRPRRRLRLRPGPLPARRRHEPGGRLLALRDVAARERVRARLDHRRQRRDLRGAPLGLRRMAVRPRPRLPEPDGAAGRRAVYEPEALAFEKPSPRQRGRVPAQGADAAVVVAAPVRGRPAARRPAAVPRSSCSRTACCATRAASCTSALLATSIALVGEGWIYQAALAAQALWLAARGRGQAAAAASRAPGSPTTTS